MQVLIVDDKKKGRNLLRKMIVDYCPEIDQVQEAESISSAVEIIEERLPDIVFLDVEMEGKNGFDFFTYFPDYSFKVILITACKAHALRAFEHAVVDYIIKPINVDRLAKSIKRVYNSFFKIESLPRFQKISTGVKKRLAVPTLNGFRIIDLEAILYCQAERNYTRIYLENGDKFLISKNLGKLEYLLKTSTFLRIHRSFIVNFNKIQQFQKGKTPIITLSDCTKLEVSVHKKEMLLQKLQVI